MTVRVFAYRGDGGYYLLDAAHELDGLREGPSGRSIAGGRGPVAAQLARVLAVAGPGRVRAVDVVIAAPKPVSVLLATEPGSVARRLVALHGRAVDEAVAYLVEEGLAEGAAAPSGILGFTHGVNRLLDPHLHTHVLVANHDARGDPLPLGRLRAFTRAADALYLASLCEGLPGATGRRAWRTHAGTTVVEGIDPGLVAVASTPRARCGRLERGGAKRHPSRAEVRARWDALVAVRAPTGLAPTVPTKTAHIDEHRFACVLGEGVVGRRDLVVAWASACTFGERADVVRSAVGLAVPAAAGPGGTRIPAVLARDPAGVRVLGPRPRATGALVDWSVKRRALARYLSSGHRLDHAVDPRGAPPRTHLALASLEAALGGRVGVPGRGGRERPLDAVRRRSPG